MPTFLLRTLWILLACFCAIPTLYAVTFSPEDVIYQQDHNGDGRLDYIVTPPVRWAPIDVDGITSLVPTPQPYSVLLQQADGSYSILQLEDFMMLPNGITPLNNLSRTYLDFNGDGIADFFLRTGTATGVISYTNANGISNSAKLDLSRYIGNGVIVMTATDINGDGMTDVVIREDNIIRAVAYGNNSGVNNVLNKLNYTLPTNNPSNMVVNLAGQLDVSDLGAATYTLPIDLPPGINGLQPAISLSYSSMNGNGPMGIGWNLAAGGSITRCGRTFEQDGVHDGVDFDADDQYCLDGQRLRMTNTGVAYAQDGQPMRTEMETFQKIVPSGNINGDPERFTVTHADGSVQIYGSDNFRRIFNANNRIASYLLAEVKDVNNNSIQYTYSKTNNAAYNIPALTQITYNGYSVQINYASRSDVIRGHLAPSTPYTYFQRVNQINVLHQGRVLYSYQLNYEQVDASLQLSRLVSIQRCLPSNSSCTPPLQFSYEKENGVMGGFNNTYNATPQTTTADQFNIKDTHNYKTGDFNADGKMDFVQLASPTVMKLWLSNGDGTFNIKTINAPAADPDLKAPNFQNDTIGSKVVYPFYPGDFDGDGDTDLVHLTGDNTMVTWLSNGNSNFTHRVTSSSRWVNPAGTDEKTGYYNYRVGEFNGDGIADLLNLYANNSVRVLLGKGDGTFSEVVTSVSTSLGTYGVSFNRYRFDQGDFNGDGLTDLVHFVSNAYVRIWLADGNGGFDIRPGFIPGANDNDIASNDYKFVLGDFNGDGKTDMVHLASASSMRTWLSRGDGTFDVTNRIVSSYDLSNAYYNFSPADVNGDGLTDLIHQRDGAADYLHVWLAKHDGSFQQQGAITTNADATKPEQFQIGDFNGDGKSDFVYLFSDNAHGRTETTGSGILKKTTIYNAIGIKSFLSTSPQYHRLNGIKDAFNNESTISYQRLLSSPRYKKIPDGEASAYPAIFMSIPLQVVSQVANVKPRGDMTTTDYDYAGLKLHQRGLGLLGFHTITTLTRTRQPYAQPLTIDDGNQYITNNNPQSAIITRTRYNQIWQTRQQGLVEDVSTYRKNLSAGATFCLLGNGCSGMTGATLLANVDNVISGLFPNNPTRFFNYISKTISEQYDVNSSNIRVWTSSTVTNTSLDTWGNPTRTNTTVTDRQNGNRVFTAVVDNSYYPANESNWQINLLSRQVQTRTTPDLVPLQPATETRTTAFEYDGLGRLLRKINEPDNATFKTEETYTYNPQGLITQTQVSAAGQTLRTNSSTYNANGTVASRSNALNHRETYAYTNTNFPWLTTSVTGPNGLTTRTEYDNIGRASKQTGADNVTSTTAWYSCAAPHANYPCSTDIGQDPEYYYNLQQTLGQQPTLTFFDRLGRNVRSLRYVFANGSDQLSTQFSRYNAEGLAYLTSKPFFAGEGVLYQRTSFDNLNRPIQVTDFDGAVSSSHYDGFKTTSTDALGRNFTTMNNALGQTLWTQDTNNQRLDFIYDAFGNLAQTTDAAGNKIQNQYDLLGRKIQMRDPDQGTWNYQYDVLGQLIKQTDAMGQVTSMTYDILGRVSTRTDAAQTTQWMYDQGTQGIGKLSSEVIGPLNQTATIGTQYQYDALGRSSSVTTSIVGGTGAGTYVSGTTYDSFSRPQTQTYPKNGLTLRYEYSTSSGQLITTKEAITGQVLWQLGEQNASGQLLKSTLGGKINRQLNYDNNNRLTQMQATAAGTTRQHWQVQYDAASNVVQRKDVLAGYTENLAYDNINRLTNTSGGSVTTNNVSYDVLGNILNKQDVGNYIYGQTCNGVKAGPHAVTQTTGGAYSASYCYDRNGNLTSKTQTNGFNQQVVYTAFNKPFQILQSDGRSTKLEYGPQRELIRQTDTQSGAVTTTIYTPGYERIYKGSTFTEKFYIGDYAVYAKTGTTTSMRYLLQDNQGSITTVLDQNGVPKENLAFDVWGKRRNANWTPATTALTSTTNRGYTGHKMLDNVGLIHMNGRVYDPVIARFVSADPIIQAPGDLQAYNRYAYVRNNPGSLVDPSGYSWLGNFWKKNKRGFFQNLFGPIGRNSQTIRNIQTVGVCIMTGPALCGTAVAANAYASGASTSQALRAGALSMVGAYVGQQIAGYTGGKAAGSPQNVLGNGIGGGVQSRINGGSFQDGFVGGAVGAYGSSLNIQGYHPMAIATLAGGTASYLSGGKFGEGAYAGAFGYWWNARLHPSNIKAEKMAAEITERGYIKSKGEADWLYEINSDPNLTVNLRAEYLTVDMKEPFDFDRNGKMSAPASVRGFPFGQGGIHGNVSVVDRLDGTYGIYNSQYDFEMKSWLSPSNWLRNLNTLTGPTSCLSCGTGYKTNFQGNTNIGSFAQ